MNLPAQIITCYPPSMNLPAHGTTSPDPRKASSLIKNNTPRKQRTTSFPPGSAHTPPGETVPDRQAPEPLPAPLSDRYRLAEHVLPPGATQHKNLHSFSTAWRLLADRQAPYHRHSSTDLAHDSVDSTTQIRSMVSIPCFTNIS